MRRLPPVERPPIRSLEDLSEPGPPVQVRDLAYVSDRCTEEIRRDIRAGLLAASRHVGAGKNGRYAITRPEAARYCRDVLGLTA